MTAWSLSTFDTAIAVLIVFMRPQCPHEKSPQPAVYDLAGGILVEVAVEDEPARRSSAH